MVAPAQGFQATAFAGGGTTGAVDLNSAETAGTLPSAKGGTGLDTSSSTGVMRVQAGAWAVDAQVAQSRGGTGLDTSGATAGQLLIAKTNSAWTMAALTQGANITVANGDGTVTVSVSGTIEIGNGGTGAATAATARTALGAAAELVVINAQTGVAYQLVLADGAPLTLITLSNAGAITLTVPANATVAFPIGTQIMLAQIGAGQVTVAAAGGVTVSSAGGELKLSAQYSQALLTKIGTDTWLLSGDTTT